MTLPRAELGSSSSPIDLTTKCNFPSSVLLPVLLLFLFRKELIIFKRSVDITGATRPGSLDSLIFPLSDDISPCFSRAMINFYECVVVIPVGTPLLL